MSNEFPVKWRFGVIDNLTAPIRKMSGAFNPMVNAAKTANSQFDLLQKNTENLRKRLSKIGGSLENVGTKMSIGLTAPILAFGASAIKTAIGFDESMNKVAAMTEATGAPLLKMREMAKELGSTTQFSASEAADAMANLGQAGFKVNEILDATPGLLSLAAASGADLARSAEIASSNIAAFGLKASDAGRVADVFAQAAASSNVGIEDLAEAMKYAAPVAKQFGLSIEDTSSAMGLLGNVGIKGSMAGTTLKNVLLRLAAPASAARKIFNQLGIQATDSSGNMLGFNEIMQNMGKALKKLPQAQQLAVLDKVFGKEAIAGAGELLNQAMKIGADGKSGIEKFTESMENSKGAADRMAKTMMSGAPGAVKELSSAFEDLQLAFTESGVLSAFTSIILKVTDLFRWLSKTNPTVLQFVAVAALVVAAIGPMVLGFGMLISMIPGMITGFALLKVGLAAVGITGWAALLPFIKIIAIAAVFAASAYAIIDNWQSTKDFFADLFTSPLQQMKDMIGYAGQLAKSAGAFLGFGDGKSDVDRKLEAQGFKMADGAQGAALGADDVIKKSNEFQMRQQKASVSMDFSNLPKGTKITTDNRDGLLNMNTGMIGAL
jgi:TP901 family phage tail tape measure protein